MDRDVLTASGEFRWNVDFSGLETARNYCVSPIYRSDYRCYPISDEASEIDRRGFVGILRLALFSKAGNATPRLESSVSQSVKTRLLDSGAFYNSRRSWNENFKRKTMRLTFLSFNASIVGVRNCKGIYILFSHRFKPVACRGNFIFKGSPSNKFGIHREQPSIRFLLPIATRFSRSCRRCSKNWNSTNNCAVYGDFSKSFRYVK